MNILIIGSKGFVGAHALQHFAASGFHAWGCDVVVEYNDPRYFQVDATNADYDEIFTEQEFDVCINCSGAASVPDSLVHPYRDFHLNTGNVFRILEAIRKYNPKCRFVNLSSAAVYGNPVSLPVHEDSALQPVSPYGYHKKYAEEIAREFNRFYKVPVVNLRIFSAFGEGLKKQLFWDVAQKTVKATNLSFFGTGQEMRDFIYIQDIMRALQCVIDRSDFEGEAINVASGEGVTIKEAVTTMLDVLGWNGDIEFTGQERSGDPDKWIAGTERLRAFSFRPSFTLRQGLQAYALWLKKSSLIP